jgi:hypothetical protein
MTTLAITPEASTRGLGLHTPFRLIRPIEQKRKICFSSQVFHSIVSYFPHISG